MKLLSILFFAGGGLFLLLTVTQVLARAWDPLDVTVLDLLLISAALLIAGCVSVFAPHL